MIKYLRAGVTVLLIMQFCNVFGQTNDQLNKTLSNLQRQATQLPVEKVHLHLDKSFYSAGDTIWFKGYTVAGSQHLLTGISSVLNVELISSDNKIVKAIKLSMLNGMANGDIILADTLNDGNYHIRAYTNWMRNYSTAYFYNNTIKIVNPIVNTVFTKTNYAYSRQNNNTVVNTHITYSNINGEPYIGREVKYTMLQNKTAVKSGSGVTDNAGNIDITLTDPSSLSALNLVTAIQLSGKTVTKQFTLTPAVKTPDVQFFPESGSLVNGIPSKVAFKAVAPNGLGADIKGNLIDDQNTTITSFSSSNLGMGSFVFTPQQGRTYKAKVDFNDGRSSIVDLPKPADNGYVLNIDNTKDATLDVKILSVNMPGEVTLVAQAGGEIYFAGKSSPGKSMFTASIPKNKFPTGIVQFTLFSATGEPLNERLVFIQNHDQLKLNVNSDKNNYTTREKVKIDINAADNSQPVTGNFSVAVTNESQLPVDENAETTILTNLLLTSDLTGYIEKPNYYFINNNEKAHADLDVLMLTQGYHRFDWKKLASGENKAMDYLPELGLTISGRVVDRSNKPVVGGRVSLFSITGGDVLDTLTNNQGRFVFDNINFKDSTQVTIKAYTAQNGNKVKIQLDEPPAPINVLNTDNVIVNTTGDDAVHLSYLASAKKIYDEKFKLGLAEGGGTLLQEVSIKSIRKKALENSRNLNGPGNANQVIYADNLFKGCPTFQDCMAGRLAGVDFNNDKGAPVSTRVRASLDSNANISMAVIYNGVFVTPGEEGAFLRELNMNEVAAVEVLRSGQYTAIYGSRGGNGVIIITRKQGGKDINVDMDAPKYVSPYSGFLNFAPTGYYKARQFYSPKYDVNLTQTPDIRSTIYWNPSLQTDSSGHTSFEYFNADSKGTYRVVVEGIDNAGHIGRQVYKYKVE